MECCVVFLVSAGCTKGTVAEFAVTVSLGSLVLAKGNGIRESTTTVTGRHWKSGKMLGEIGYNDAHVPTNGSLNNPGRALT
jgi:hypothetical protein